VAALYLISGKRENNQLALRQRRFQARFIGEVKPLFKNRCADNRRAPRPFNIHCRTFVRNC
jgi:hypothetical protein